MTFRMSDCGFRIDCRSGPVRSVIGQSIRNSIRNRPSAIRNLVVAAFFMALTMPSAAQSLSYTKGQNVAPAYEGWEQGADGAKYFVFGYMTTTPVSRRGLLQAVGTGALTMWIPKPVSGYTAEEMRAKAADGSIVGTSKWELDTPALCVDLDKMDRNIATLQSRLAGTGVASRPHAKTHKCPEIAKRQLAGGSIGICTAKVSEAEALFAGGVAPIVMTTGNVTANKIRRAMTLRKANPQFIQAVDHPKNARDLSDAAKAFGLTADVVVDVAVGTRSGVPPDNRAIELAQLVDKLPNLKLRGMLSYDGGAQHIKGFKKRYADTLERFQPSVKTFEAFKKSGLNTEIFSGGGSGTYNIVTKVPGFTDVQAGSYIFMLR